MANCSGSVGYSVLSQTRHKYFDECRKVMKDNSLEYVIEKKLVWIDGVLKTSLPAYMVNQLKTPGWKYDNNDCGKWAVIQNNEYEGLPGQVVDGFLLISLHKDWNPLSDYSMTDELWKENIANHSIIFSYTKKGEKWVFKLEYSCLDDITTKTISIDKETKLVEGIDQEEWRKGKGKGEYLTYGVYTIIRKEKI